MNLAYQMKQQIIRAQHRTRKAHLNHLHNFVPPDLFTQIAQARLFNKQSCPHRCAGQYIPHNNSNDIHHILSQCALDSTMHIYQPPPQKPQNQRNSSCAGNSITVPYQYIDGGASSQRTNPYKIPQHINGHGDLENVSRVLWVPKVHKAHPTNGADRHGIRKVCHKIWEVGTMVETIQPVRPPNFLNNMIQISYTGHTLPPCDLRATFPARHECTTPSVSPTQGATPKRGSPSAQLEGLPTWRSEL